MRQLCEARKPYAGIRVRLLVSLGGSTTPRMHAFSSTSGTLRLKIIAQACVSAASASWCPENKLQASFFASQCPWTHRKHSAAVRFDFAVPLGAFKTLRGCAFLLGRASWRLENISQANAFACQCHNTVQAYVSAALGARLGRPQVGWSRLLSGGSVQLG
jgi:hypothetical protein